MRRAKRRAIHWILLSIFSTLCCQSWASTADVINFCQEALVTIKPKLGLTSSRQPDFDVRIVSQWGGRSQWSNQELKQAAIKSVSETKAALKNLGFSHGHYLNVLVEKHPDAISSPVYSTGTCLAAGAFGMVTTPNILGFRSLFFGDTKKEDTFENMPRTLVLKALTSQYHSLFSPFSVAHELAHDSEPNGSPRSWIWIEARADFLAFAVTGKREIVWPAHEGALIFDDFGNMSTTDHEEVKRSMLMPRVQHVRNLVPNQSAYHENSEIISSFLFRLARAHGLETALKFVRWMDIQESKIILDLEQIRDSAGQEIEKGPAIKSEWRRVVGSIFDAITKWSASQNADVQIWTASELKRINQ